VDVDETSDAGGPQRLCLLASALAGRNVTVAPADPGEPAWTDGVTVFVDAVASAVHQVESVTVQASLLACGGLEPDIVRKLVRRRALARRYLAVEGQRALTANDDLLPFPVRSIVDLDLAMRSDSPAASLQDSVRSGCDRRSAGQLRRDQAAEPVVGARCRSAFGLRRARPSSRDTEAVGRTRGHRRRIRRRRCDGPVLQSHRRGRSRGESVAALDEPGSSTQRRRPTRGGLADASVAEGDSRRRCGDLCCVGAFRHRGCRRRRQAGKEVSRVGLPPSAISARLVHGARNRSAPHTGRTIRAPRCSRLAAAAHSAWDRARSLPSTAAGRRHRRRRRGRSQG